MEKNNMLKWNKAYLSKQNYSMVSPRWGHACCVINDQIIFFGGYADSTYMNDLWVFNITQNTFRQIKTKGNIPQCRSNSSMNYDQKNNRIIIFGGGASNKKRFNSISILDWRTKEWTQINPREDQLAPWARTYHTAEFRFPYLIVFGGQSILDLDDLWIFNTLTKRWKQVIIQKNTNKPCARRFHSSVIVKNQIVIIAGCYGRYRSLNDIWSIDLTNLFENDDYTNLVWKQRKYEGNTFLTRWGHTSSALNQKIYVFGGRFSNDLNDLLVIDLQNQSIKNVKNVEDVPLPRRRHSATFFGSVLLIFGGFNGQYYNDLHYINLKDNKNMIPKLGILNKLENLVNNKLYSDLRFFDKKGEQIFIHQQIFMKRFENRYYAESFISYLYQLPNQVIKNFLKFIYTGLGDINHQIYNKFKMKGRLTQKSQYKSYYNTIKNELKGNWVNSNIVPGQSELQNIIKLNQKQWQLLFTEVPRQIYTQTFKINNRIIKSSKILLSLNSKYFQCLLSEQFAQNQIIQIQSVSQLIFMIIIKYLEYDIAIVPEYIKFKQWIQLIQAAKYFQLQRLVKICQYQLIILLNNRESSIGYFQRVNSFKQYTIEKLFQFAIKENLQHLKNFCAECQIKKLVQQQKSNISYNLFSQSANMNKIQREIVKAKDIYLKSIYLQLKQIRYRKNIDNHRKMITNLDEQKENVEVNN